MNSLFGELSNLARWLKTHQNHYGNNLESAQANFENFKEVECSVEQLGNKIAKFVSQTEVLIKCGHPESHSMQRDVGQLHEKWNDLLSCFGEYRNLCQMALTYFDKVTELEQTVKRGTELLVDIGRRSVHCITPDHAQRLVNEIDEFCTINCPKQDSRSRKIMEMATELYGPKQAMPMAEPYLAKNRELENSLNQIRDELWRLKLNLDQKMLEDEMKKNQKPVEEVPIVPTEVKKEHTQPLLELIETKPPRFVQHLKDGQQDEGKAFKFQCKIEGDQPMKIQWFKDNLPLTSPDYSTSYNPDTGICQLRVDEVIGADTAVYACLATNSAGVDQTAAYLHVNEQKLEPPVFTKTLKPVEVNEGQMMVMDCQVKGFPQPQVSWFKDDNCIDDDNDYVIAYTNQKCHLSVRKVTPATQGRFTCQAKNSAGEASTSCDVKVLTDKKPNFLEQLRDITVKEGSEVRLLTYFNGQPTPDVFWFYDSKPLVDYETSTTDNSTCLTIHNSKPTDSGVFTVVAKNKSGEARTFCRVKVEPLVPEVHPEIQTQWPEPCKPLFIEPLKDQEVVENQPALLECKCFGVPPPTNVKWIHNGRQVMTGGPFKVSTSGDVEDHNKVYCRLDISKTSLNDGGEYKCIARNAHGIVETSCNMTVKRKLCLIFSLVTDA